MKRTVIPGGAILMGLVVSLTLLGVGYGLWSDTLRISGAVATGSVNAAFSLHELDEGLVRGAPNGPSDNGVNEDKEMNGIDTAECYVRLTSPTPVLSTDPVAVDDELIARPPSDFMFVLMKNAYPSFNCYVDFDVHNAGAIPMKVSKPALGPLPPATVLTVEFQNCYEDGVQVEPGKEVLCTLHIHVERGAQANTVYRFGATICAYQWNAASPVRCPIPVDIEPVPADLDRIAPVPAPAR